MDRTVFIVAGLLLLAAFSVWLSFRASPATCSEARSLVERAKALSPAPAQAGSFVASGKEGRS